MIEPISPYPLPPDVRTGLLECAADSDLLLFGETHGTQEVPRLVLGLLDDLAALGYRGIGLEIPGDQRDALTGWAQGTAAEPPSFFTPGDFPDGRGNVQVLSFVQQVIGRAGGWHLLCFDQTGNQSAESWADRDAWMARNLLTQWDQHCTGQKVVAICGNIHSRLIPPASPDDHAWPSFASNVQRFSPQLRVHSLNVIFHAGACFNQEARPFSPASPPLEAAAEIRPSVWLGHTLELHLPQATPVTFVENR